MKKRIFASLLALVMAFSLLPASALAADMSWTWTVTVFGGNYCRADGVETSTNKYTINRYLDNSKDHEIGYKFEWNARAGGNTYNGGWQLCLTVDGSVVERSTAYIYTRDMSNASGSWTAPGSSHTGNSSHPFTLYLSNFPKADYSKEKTFTLNYDANGGTGEPASQTVKSSTGSATFTISTTVPTKQGYDFKGWSTSQNAAEADYQPGGRFTATSLTTTLYAVWTEHEHKDNNGDGFCDGDDHTCMHPKDNNGYCTKEGCTHPDTCCPKKPQSQPTEWDKLTIEKTASPSGTVKPGDEITYTITVTNSTGKDLTDVKVTDRLPDRLTFDSATPEGQYDPTTGVWTIPSLAAGAVATLTIKTTVKADAAAGTISNTATITGAKSDDDELNGTGNTDTSEDVSVEEPALPDLSITKTTDAKDVKVGDPFDYTITVKNTGTGDASNVVVKDILPDGLEYVSYNTNYPNKQDWEFNQNGQELTWTFKEIPAGASVTITLTVKAVTATPEGSDGYTNKAYIEGKENTPGKAPAVPVGNALTLTKTSTVQTVNVGEIFSYTLKVKNVSESDATDVVGEDVLPDSLAFYAESVRGQSGTYQFEPDAQNPQVLKWTFGTIPAGKEVTITLRVKAISAGMVKNSASITGVTEVESDAVSIVTPDKGKLTIVKKVSSKLDEDADFTFTLKRYTITENGRVLDEKFTHDPIVVHVAKNSDTGSAMVDLPDFPVSTVYTVEEENPTSELKMKGTTGVFSKAEYSCEMSSKDENGNPISTGEMAPCDSFSTLWPGQEITSVTITCTNTYELTAPAKYPVTVNKSYASSTGAGNYAADETVTLHAGSRSNYKFNGWTSDSTDVTFANAKKADTTFTMPNHAVTVTASWTYTDSSHDDDDYDYTLRYVTNGGKAISSESKSRSWVKDYEDLPVPTRVGYRFNGWYYDTKLTKAVTGDVQVSSRTVTLYAPAGRRTPCLPSSTATITSPIFRATMTAPSVPTRR